MVELGSGIKDSLDRPRTVVNTREDPRILLNSELAAGLSIPYF